MILTFMIMYHKVKVKYVSEIIAWITVKANRTSYVSVGALGKNDMLGIIKLVCNSVEQIKKQGYFKKVLKQPKAPGMFPVLQK